MYVHTAEATHYSPLPPLLEKVKKKKKNWILKSVIIQIYFLPEHKHVLCEVGVLNCWFFCQGSNSRGEQPVLETKVETEVGAGRGSNQ